ncbi:MAG TPA: DNA polymerase III subunit beta [Gammaproteobacteria bacterium]|nr:DNA polymerase III subunit beta [Gammaproteobacteria bacterium]
MKLSITREDILKPLQQISGVIERRQSLPVLSNVLVRCQQGTLSLTGTDLELELIATTQVNGADDGEITLPARKFLDICRALPEGAEIRLEVDGEKARIRSGRSRFTLATLPASEFPNVEGGQAASTFSLPCEAMKRLIDRTQFAMAQQDVRYYLNGLMLELDRRQVRAVATDGHRLALSEIEADSGVEEVRQVILPRKGVGELAKLMADGEGEAHFELGNNHMRVIIGNVVFTSKLIDGKFPDYRRVIPEKGGTEIVCDRELLRQAFQRASVLSNEKYRGMRIRLGDNLLTATVHNPEQEEAEEELEVQYNGEPLEIGFNVAYFLDVLNVIPGEEVVIALRDANTGCLVTQKGDTSCQYVIMPMRL